MALELGLFTAIGHHGDVHEVVPEHGDIQMIGLQSQNFHP